MNERLRYFLKKTRRYQLLFAALAVVCLLVFLVFNFSLNERAGAFNTHAHVDQQVEVPVTRDGLKTLNIEASDVRLEVGMVESLTRPQVILAGRGYEAQSAKVDLDGTECTVRLLENDGDAHVQDLTMQVLLPECDLDSLIINGEALDLHVERVRTTYLAAVVADGGYAYFADVKADSMEVAGGDTPLRFYGNDVSFMNVSSTAGSQTYLENELERVDATSQEGGIFCYDTRLKGQWDIESDTGNITMLSKNLPYNTMIQALAQNGSVTMGYDGRYWKDASVVAENEQAYVGSVGGSPDKLITASTGSGNITIGQRERYSDLDPYAADYPFAETNPYLIERSTITK